jgi:Holliday junction DNA helicase RuvB
MYPDEAVEFLKNNLEYVDILKKAVELEENIEQDANRPLLEWEWYEIQTHPSKINKLITNGFIEVVYKTNRATYYKLADQDSVKLAVEQIENRELNQDTYVENDTSIQDIQLPEDLFKIIVGYDDIKEIIIRGLDSETPVNVLFIGTPGTAKSLFLEELNRIPGSSYHLGSSSTKAGLSEFLFSTKPQILLIDEIEKMDRKDYAVLLSLMEGGKIVETKHNKRREEYLKTSVFAACNSLKKIPPENLSRFHFKFRFNPYTKDEFMEIVYQVLVDRENLETHLAKYIADKLSQFTKDVRVAVGISRVCKTTEDVDRTIEIMNRYKST